eukprot:6186203-Pleurochrysis_carterae.AAC.3
MKGVRLRVTRVSTIDITTAHRRRKPKRNATGRRSHWFACALADQAMAVAAGAAGTMTLPL